MGYLVRRPNTYLYRLALMPFTIWVILRGSFGYAWVNELHGPYNFGQGERLPRPTILSLVVILMLVFIRTIRSRYHRKGSRVRPNQKRTIQGR